MKKPYILYKNYTHYTDKNFIFIFMLNLKEKLRS